MRYQTIFIYITSSFFAVIYSYIASQRKITGDTLNYINFYTDISIKNWSYSNCQGFEPLFCYVSRLLMHIGWNPATVHTIWAFLVAILIYSAIVRYQSKFIVKLTFLAIPLALNFFHPTEVYFLTRQFIAGAFLMNLFISQSRASHLLWSLLAITTHFFSLPLIVLFLISRYNIVSLFLNNAKYIVPATLLVVYFFEKEINIIRATLEYKILHYDGKSDGSLSVIAEIKFLLYFLVSYILVRGNDRAFLVLCAIFYVATFTHELAHLRYHKYLYFVFMYMFLHSVRLQLSWFVGVVAFIGSYRMISVVKWL